VLDSSGNLIGKEENRIPPFSTNYGGGYGAYIFQNTISYWNSIVDTVFTILPDLTEKPSFIISPGEHRWPRKNLLPGEITKYLTVLQVFETRQLLMFKYIYLDEGYFAIITKGDKKPHLVKLELNGYGGIPNDLDGGTVFLPLAYYTESSREYLAGLVNPYKMKTHINTHEFKESSPQYPDKKDKYNELVNSLEETDNPVLVIVRLKRP
jgi:hypothetical protein